MQQPMHPLPGPGMPGGPGPGGPVHPSSVPGQQMQMPPQMPGQMPPQMQGQMPGQMPHQMTGHMPPQMQGHMPPQMQGQMPGQMPPGYPPMQGAPPPNRRILQPLEGVRDGKKFSLLVAQQPVRARMCGFGDKDRRPITPPPCIRLIITDVKTGEEISPADIDPTYFVLNVDLWNEDGTQEVNLVRHSSNSPAVSISTSTVCGYPPLPERAYIGLINATQVSSMGAVHGLPPPPHMAYPPPGSAPPGMPPTPQHTGGHPEYPDHYQQQQSMAPAGQPNMHPSQMGQPGAPPPSQGPPPGMHMGYMQPQMQGAPGSQPYPMHAIPIPIAQQQAGMFTRNLIGSLSVNAFKLSDTEGHMGFWFILQDLSVRTEGAFRLKMSFVDVGDGHGSLNTGKAPVLATVYSQQFQVYSAKKFPGVIESTPLSKVFAGQGIKIPIRKDGPKRDNQAEYDADD